MGGLERAHRLVALLVTPAEFPAGSSGSSLELPPRNWFLSILEAKNREFVNSVDGALHLTGDISFDFVRCCVNSLINLKLELNLAVGAEPPKKQGGPRLEPDALSIGQQKNVHALTEMIVSLGVIPNLLPGIGLALDKRSQFLQKVLQTLPAHPILEQYKQLVFSLDALLELTRQRSLATLILTRHLGDLLAALIQVSSAPLLKPASTLDSQGSRTTPSRNENKSDEASAVLDKFVMTEELYERLSNDQAKYGGELTAIVERTYQPTIVKHLISLQSSSASPPAAAAKQLLSAATATTRKKSSKTAAVAPKWFARRVGELLSGRLTANQHGVAHVIRGVLDLGDGAAAGATTMDWTKIELVANVLASPPEGNYASVEAYYAMICPQILRLITDSEDKIVQMIACAAVRTMAERSLILSRRYLLNVLMTPFLRLSADYGTSDEMVAADQPEPELPTEQELDDCLKTLYKVFVIGNDPTLMFIAHLAPIILLLLNLHASIALAGISHLVGPVKQLVQRYLKHSDRATAAAILRAFAFNEVPDSSEIRLGQVKKMNQDLVFSAGAEGGVIVQQRALADQQSSFYVSDDEKSIVVQDLLDDLKDKQLATDFFLGLMHDLTDMMVEGEQEEELELPPLQPGQDLEQALRDMEKQLDETMAKMRRNLMVIRLLGLLSEDMGLQDSLLAESERMIDFIGETIKRAAVSVRKAPPGGGSPGGMAIQSLNMALSILSLHLTQKNIQMSDWEKMQKYADDLNCLSLHADYRIAKIAGQLYQLVLTHGTIIRENENIRRQTRRIQEETEKMKNKAAELRKLKRSQEDEQLDQKKEQLRAKAEQLKRAKEERRRRHHQGQGEEEAPELKIVEDKAGLSQFEAALYDVTDPLLPVRGHGIIELARLVDTKDEETLAKLEQVMDIFKESLEDDDTYIYLSAINGLVACARHRTCPVLDALTREFTMVGDRSKLAEAGPDKMVEIKTKIGEALVRATKELGELTPAYKNQLLNAFLSASNDPEAMVRASSLSNLGEVCRNLRFSLGSVAGELMVHLEQASRDVSVEVRRAAAMVLTMTLEGLGRDAFRVLESCLRDIYRALRLRQSVEQDEVTLTHLGLAMAEIDAIVRQLFTPRPELEKKIYVLDAPPDLF